MCTFDQVRICPGENYLVDSDETHEKVFLYDPKKDASQTFYEISRVQVTFPPWGREDVHNACRFLMCEIWERNTCQREEYCNEPQVGLVFRTKVDDSLCPGQFLLGCYVLAHPDTVLLVQTVGSCLTAETVQNSFQKMLAALHCILVDEKPVSVSFEKAAMLGKEMQTAVENMQVENLVQQAMECDNWVQSDLNEQAENDGGANCIPNDARNPASKNRYSITELYTFFASYFSPPDMIEFKGKRFAFSGFRHKEMYYLADQIEAFGGTYQLNVAGNTDYLVCDSAMNSKASLLQTIQRIDRGERQKLIWRKDLENVLEHFSEPQQSSGNEQTGSKETTEDLPAAQSAVTVSNAAEISGDENHVQEGTPEEGRIEKEQSAFAGESFAQEMEEIAVEAIACPEQAPADTAETPKLQDSADVEMNISDPEQTQMECEPSVQNDIAELHEELQPEATNEILQADEEELQPETVVLPADDEIVSEQIPEECTEQELCTGKLFEQEELVAEPAAPAEFTEEEPLENGDETVSNENCAVKNAEERDIAQGRDEKKTDSAEVAYLQSEEVHEQKVTTRKEGCYIATAVYGSYDAPSVRVLRRFRDERLQKSCAGRWFIRMYYRLSPPIARRLKDASVLNRLVRRCLDRFVDHLL